MRRVMDTHRSRTRLAIALAMAAALALAGSSRAQEPGQVALAFVFDDGHLESLCVSIEDQGGGFTGADLLDRSGLDVIVDASSGMGITVCQVVALGCPYPAKPCFCQCMSGSDCAYWNYYYRDPGQAEWTYSPLGAKLRKLQPGTIEVWVWGDVRTPPPADLSFESVCGSIAGAATAAPTALEVTVASLTPLPPAIAATATDAVTPPETPAPAPTTTQESPPVQPSATPAPNPAAIAATGWSAYWPFGLIVLAMGAIGLLAWWRRSRGV